MHRAYTLNIQKTRGTIVTHLGCFETSHRWMQLPWCSEGFGRKSKDLWEHLHPYPSLRRLKAGPTLVARVLACVTAVCNIHAHILGLWLGRDLNEWWLSGWWWCSYRWCSGVCSFLGCDFAVFCVWVAYVKPQRILKTRIVALLVAYFECSMGLGHFLAFR